MPTEEQRLPPGARAAELDSLHRRGSVALLQAEAQLAQALTARGAAAVESGSVEDRQRRLREATAAAVLLGRQDARGASSEALQPQIALAAEVNPALPALLEVTSEGFSYDRARAVAIAESFTGRWTKRVEKLIADGMPVDDAAVAGIEQLDKRINVIAATEAAEAFDSQRLDDLAAYGNSEAYQREVEREAAFVPFQWWNAVLDKRTCRDCSHAHDKIVLLWENFPEGRPGGVHPSCRCVADIVLLPAWYRTYERAVEAAVLGEEGDFEGGFEDEGGYFEAA